MPRAPFEFASLADAAALIGISFPPNRAEGHITAIRHGDDTVPEPDMAFHLISMMSCEEFGMAISDSVRISATGCEMLTR